MKISKFKTYRQMLGRWNRQRKELEAYNVKLLLRVYLNS